MLHLFLQTHIYPYEEGIMRKVCCYTKKDPIDPVVMAFYQRLWSEESKRIEKNQRMNKKWLKREKGKKRPETTVQPKISIEELGYILKANHRYNPKLPMNTEE